MLPRLFPFVLYIKIYMRVQEDNTRKEKLNKPKTIRARFLFDFCYEYVYKNKTTELNTCGQADTGPTVYVLYAFFLNSLLTAMAAGAADTSSPIAP